ncbi:DUF2202 domain-containing protein [Sulfurovum sp.]|uniref:DUF2202 domain-containing protein n=1 Tax=Sulfurovum sp. TaxID=1969726 RepID=UPI002867D7E9|nr:DUF2202 domain-containing protein [Sulfurovum sp.]
MSINMNPTTILSDEQKDMLFFIYEGEKVARDVYITLGEVHKDEDTFALMQFSEQRHMNCTRDLCDTYGVEISQVNEENVGKFESLVLQTLYDACTEKGEKSLHDALEVGEYIENVEIEDLEQATVGMPSDVVNVYENIKKRNLRHMDTFQAALARAA